jgi:HemY protein
MIRVLIYLVIVALLAFGAVWLAERPGDVVITWQGERVETSVMVLMAAAAAVAVAAVLLWSIARAIVGSPDAVSRFLRNRRGVRAYQAVSRGLIAVGSGDARAARKFTTEARRIAPDEPLTLLLSAQAAQLAGNRDAAAATFQQMSERHDTKVLGLHGLFVEARRRNDPAAALFYAEEAAKETQVPPWAGQAVLEFRCIAGDWSAALVRLERNMKSGLIDKTAYRRQRAVLLTAQALAAEDGTSPPVAGQPDAARDRARECALEAVKLAPDLVPAAALAGRLLGAAGEKRKATRIIEAAWRANPHPDLADAFAHLQPGDSARERLARVESLAAKATGDAEAAIAVARAALDAKEFAVARAALVPLVEMPTRRVAALMAALELQEGDEGRGREWMARTLNARRDPAWTADGFVSDHWLPVSPVTGRLDAFEWRDPLAGVDHTGATIDAEQRALLDAPRAAPPPLAVPMPAADHTDAVVAAPASELHATPAGKSDGASAASASAESDGLAPPSGKGDSKLDIDADEPLRPSEPSSPHDEPRPPPVIALAHVPDDPGPESGPPPEEPAVEPGAVAPPDGWSRFRARFR